MGEWNWCGKNAWFLAEVVASNLKGFLCRLHQSYAKLSHLVDFELKAWQQENPSPNMALRFKSRMYNKLPRKVQIDRNVEVMENVGPIGS